MGSTRITLIGAGSPLFGGGIVADILASRKCSVTDRMRNRRVFKCKGSPFIHALKNVTFWRVHGRNLAEGTEMKVGLHIMIDG